jgi:hypothetical protein
LRQRRHLRRPCDGQQRAPAWSARRSTDTATTACSSRRSGDPRHPDEEIQQDSDGNGIGDACKATSTADGVPDQLDNCPFNRRGSDRRQENDIGDVCDLSWLLQGRRGRRLLAPRGRRR